MKIINDIFFKAVANPYRRQIINLLKWKNMTVGEIVDLFDISQPSISRHLDILKQAEIVIADKKANQIVYSLNLSVMKEISIYFQELFNCEKGEDFYDLKT